MTTLVEAPPPPVDVAGPGGGSDWVVLTTADNDIEAHLLEGCLNAEGIEVRAVKDHSGPSWLLNGSDPWAPVSLWVRRHQYDDSQVVLAEVAYAAPEAVPHTRPNRVSPMRFWAIALGLGLALSGIGFARSLDHVQRCGFSTTCEGSP